MNNKYRDGKGFQDTTKYKSPFEPRNKYELFVLINVEQTLLSSQHIIEIPKTGMQETCIELS